MEQPSLSDKIQTVMYKVESEVTRALVRFPSMRSAHEGEAIIREEMDEFTDAVRHKSGAEAYAEAIQVAAMAIRYCAEIGSQGAEKPTE